jgi:phosphonate transport system substrate-binding protein
MGARGNRALNISIIIAAVAFGLLICGVYFSIIHRRVDASVSMASTPIPSVPKPLHKGLTFNVAVASMISPMKSFRMYHELAERLAREFGRPLEIITRDSYAEVNELLGNGQVDVAFVCSGGYASAPDAMDVIAAPIIDGRPEYYALVIVPANSTAQKFEDLRGRSFLFMEPESNTGYWYAFERLADMGESPESFFSEFRWTGSHDRSILAISQEMAGGASVHSVIYGQMVSQDEALSRRIRVLEKSLPYPSPPVVVRKTMPVPQRKRLVQTLVQLSETEEGRAILRGMGIDGFAPANNLTYQSLPVPGSKDERQ